MTLTQVIHYSKDDKKFGGDYWSIDLKDEMGRLIAQFGDYYHDKGDMKVDGFIEGVEWATGKKVELKTIKVADSE